LEQGKCWWAHVRTVRRVGKHLPSILFQNFRYCTWGMRPRVNVWLLVTARDLTPVSFFFHFKAPFCRTWTTQPVNTHTMFFTEVWLTTVAKIRKIASPYWPRKRSVQNFLKWPTYVNNKTRSYVRKVFPMWDCKLQDTDVMT
jgi:hypothetical protein